MLLGSNHGFRWLSHLVITKWVQVGHGRYWQRWSPQLARAWSTTHVTTDMIHTHIYIYMFIHNTCTCVCMCVFRIYTYPYSHISQQACRVPCRKCIQATGFRKLRTPQRSAQLRLGQSQESLQHMLAGPATGDHWRPNIFSAPFQGQRFTAKLPGLVNIQKTMENHHFQWVNPL